MKIALIGYGKMGKEIEKIALSRGHEIVSIIDINNREDFASEAFRSADVAIEFTAPSVAYGNCLEAFKNGVKVVSGSTGCPLRKQDPDAQAERSIYLSFCREVLLPSQRNDACRPCIRTQP